MLSLSPGAVIEAPILIEAPIQKKHLDYMSSAPALPAGPIGTRCTLWPSQLNTREYKGGKVPSPTKTPGRAVSHSLLSISQQHTRCTGVLYHNSTSDAQAKAQRSVLSANVHFTKDGSAALAPVAPPELLCDTRAQH